MQYIVIAGTNYRIVAWPCASLKMAFSVWKNFFGTFLELLADLIICMVLFWMLLSGACCLLEWTGCRALSGCLLAFTVEVNGGVCVSAEGKASPRALSPGMGGLLSSMKGIMEGDGGKRGSPCRLGTNATAPCRVEGILASIHSIQKNGKLVNHSDYFTVHELNVNLFSLT